MGATNRWTPNTPNNLNLISWNCRGIKARDSDLRELLDQYQPDVLLLQETLLKHPNQVNFKITFRIFQRPQRTYQRRELRYSSRKILLTVTSILLQCLA